MVGIAGRGRVEDDHGSSGPGTKTKCEECRSGKEVKRSVRALNPSGILVSQMTTTLSTALQIY